MPHAGEFLTAPSFTAGGRVRTRSKFGIGYEDGAGGTVTQLVSKSEPITLDAICGRITMHAANLLAGTAVSFTWTNAFIGAVDLIVWNQRAGTNGAYALFFTPDTGTCVVTLRNLTAGALAEAFSFNFAITKSTTL